MKKTLKAPAPPKQDKFVISWISPSDGSGCCCECLDKNTADEMEHMFIITNVERYSIWEYKTDGRQLEVARKI